MPKTRAGKRIASVSDACATAFPAVRAIPAAAAAKTAVPARAPVNAAPEREARRPERAAEMAVNPAKASGASDSTKDAASGSMPAVAR